MKPKPAKKKRKASLPSAQTSACKAEPCNAARIAFQLDQSFQTVFRIADSDDDMAEYITGLIIPVLCNALVWLEARICFERREAMFQRLAKHSKHWPVLYYAHRENRKRVEDYMARLRLGSGLGVQFEGKTFSQYTHANIIVATLHEILDKWRKDGGINMTVLILNGRQLTADEKKRIGAWIRHTVAKLPVLSRDPASLKLWKKAGAELIPFYYGKNYHADPALRTLGLPNGKIPTKDHFPKTGTRRERTTAQEIPNLAAWRKLIRRTIADAWECVASVGGE